MDSLGYFQRLKNMTPTRMWINNPTLRESDLAIEAGAISCTTNPTYAMKMIQKEERSYIDGIFEKAFGMSSDDERIAELVQMEFVRNVLKRFLPVFKKSAGDEGFVSIQGNPYVEEDADRIVSHALENREMGENIIAKIPATEAGIAAIERLIPEDIPIIATEIMGIAQMVTVCELYERVSKSCGKSPKLFVTHITGIFDDHLKNVAKEQNIDISEDVLWQAGTIVARRQYQLMKERNYPGIMLGGGARGLHHFTEFVGGDMHVTINYEGTADKLIESDPPVVYRIDNPTPQYVINELLEKFPDFGRAYHEDGLKVEEYKDFGPVVLFRNSFLKGWDYLNAEIHNYKVK